MENKKETGRVNPSTSQPQQKVNSQLQSRFCIGEHVTAVAFVDCFGKQVKETTGLFVESIRLIEPSSALDSMKPYFRIKACDPLSPAYIEGAESFFTSVETPASLTDIGSNLVSAEDACPRCGERDADKLELPDEEDVHPTKIIAYRKCLTCGYQKK